MAKKKIKSQAKPTELEQEKKITKDIQDRFKKVTADTTKISELRLNDDLSYRHYTIESLVEHTSFAEVSYLLLYGELPYRRQLNDFRRKIERAMHLPPNVRKVMKGFKPSPSPIEALRIALLALARQDESVKGNSSITSHEACVTLIGRVFGITRFWAEHNAKNKTWRSSIRGKSSLGAVLFGSIKGRDPKPEEARLLDTALILFAEHGFAPSTFVARSIASTGSDIHSAVCGAIGSLNGPLHGGAIAEALTQWREIEHLIEKGGGSFEKLKSLQDPEKSIIYNWIKDQKEQAKKIMGFGHRMYKHGDCREHLLRKQYRSIADNQGKDQTRALRTKNAFYWFDLASALKDLMLELKGIHANLDLAAAYSLHELGIEDQYFSTVFACGRIVGWCAHVREQQENNCLIRPLSKYIGRQPRLAQPIGDRTEPPSSLSEAKTNTLSEVKTNTNRKGARVFISYSSEDRAFVDKLVSRLDEASSVLDIWVDSQRLKVGDSIVEGINKGLQAADYVIPVLSNNSKKSNWAKRELASAIMEELSTNQGLAVLPIRIDNCELPPLLRDSIYADFRGNFETGFEKLMEALSIESKSQDKSDAFIEGTDDCMTHLGRMARGTLRRILTARLTREQVNVVWFDTLDSMMDDLLPNQGKDRCVIELLGHSTNRNLDSKLYKSICDNYPFVASEA